jgi:hypothetical protein
LTAVLTEMSATVTPEIVKETVEIIVGTNSGINCQFFALFAQMRSIISKWEENKKLVCVNFYSKLGRKVRAYIKLIVSTDICYEYRL